jgi:hypothetical protein
MPFNVNTATSIDPDQLDDIFEYHKWDEAKIEKGKRVRKVLAEAFAQIIENVPPCPDRSVALRKIREARMDCNSAITHEGKY